MSYIPLTLSKFPASNKMSPSKKKFSKRVTDHLLPHPLKCPLKTWIQAWRRKLWRQWSKGELTSLTSPHIHSHLTSLSYWIWAYQGLKFYIWPLLRVTQPSVLRLQLLRPERSNCCCSFSLALAAGLPCCSDLHQAKKWPANSSPLSSHLPQSTMAVDWGFGALFRADWRHPRPHQPRLRARQGQSRPKNCEHWCSLFFVHSQLNCSRTTHVRL